MAKVETLALLILGFDENSKPTKDELSHAFKMASLKFHPDAGGNTFTFRGLTLAKEIVEASLPVPKKPKESSTSSKNSYSNKDSKYTYREKTPQECQNDIYHHARIAVIHLSGFVSRLKTLTVSIETIGTLTVTITGRWDVTAIALPTKYHKDIEVLTLYANALAWLNNKSEEKFTSTATISHKGRTLDVVFDYERKSVWERLKETFTFRME